FSSIAWDTSATDSFQPENISDEEVSKVTTESIDEISTYNDDAMFSTLASSLNYPVTNSMNPDQLSHSSGNNNTVISNTFPMTITVTEPLKEFDGTKDAFISYLITTKTTLDTFSSPTVSVRRRFQDFVWLHSSLSRDFAACVVPPLPDRHRMEYITGDRFGSEFVEKRRASLQRFLGRLSRHPTLQKSDYFRLFLESREWKTGDGVFENLGDALLNAFSKLKKPDEKFLEIKEGVDKLEENLQTIDRLHQRIIKRQTDLEADYRDFGSSIAGLGQLETGVTDPLEQFGETVSKFADAWKRM
ncbi:5289_t:CDS:2, partial [Scutellospora calospora]